MSGTDSVSCTWPRNSPCHGGAGETPGSLRSSTASGPGATRDLDGDLGKSQTLAHHRLPDGEAAGGNRVFVIQRVGRTGQFRGPKKPGTCPPGGALHGGVRDYEALRATHSAGMQRMARRRPR